MSCFNLTRNKILFWTFRQLAKFYYLVFLNLLSIQIELMSFHYSDFKMKQLFMTAISDFSAFQAARKKSHSRHVGKFSTNVLVQIFCIFCENTFLLSKCCFNQNACLLFVLFFIVCDIQEVFSQMYVLSQTSIM